MIDTPAGTTPPAEGGHVVISPDADFPFGMVGRVIDVAANSNGGATATLEQAPLDEALDDVTLDISGQVQPQFPFDDGSATVAPAARGRNASPDKAVGAGLNALECRDAAGNAIAPSSLLSPTGSSIAILAPSSLDASGTTISPGQSVNLQLKGAITAELGFTAHSELHCALSKAFLRKATFSYQLPAGPVPVNLTLAPKFDLDVTAAGKVTLARTYSYTIKVTKTAGEAPVASLTTDHDDVTPSVDAGVHASLFIGATASIGVGGRFAGVAVDTGLRGTFGPRFTADAHQCLTVDASLDASLEMFLDTFSVHWDHELASMSYGPVSMIDTCPHITTTTLPLGLAGHLYDATLSADNGQPAYRWAIKDGSLPNGLQVTEDGHVKGNLAAAGTSTFTVQVTDGRGAVGTRQLILQSVTRAATTDLLAVLSSVAENTLTMRYAVSIPDGLDLWGSGFGGVCFDVNGDRATNFSGVMVFDYAVSDLAPSADPVSVDLPLSLQGFARVEQHCGLYYVGLKNLNGDVAEFGDNSSIPDESRDTHLLSGSEFDVHPDDVP